LSLICEGLGCSVRKLPVPLGWPADELHEAAVVARFHRGGLPHARHRELHTLPLAQRRAAVYLAGILRLANAFDSEREGHVKRVRFEPHDGTLVLWAEGLVPMTRNAESISGARYVLETWLKRPILVRPWVHRVRRRALGPKAA